MNEGAVKLTGMSAAWHRMRTSFDFAAQHLHCDAATLGKASWCGALITFGLDCTDFRLECRKHSKA